MIAPCGTTVADGHDPTTGLVVDEPSLGTAAKWPVERCRERVAGAGDGAGTAERVL